MTNKYKGYEGFRVKFDEFIDKRFCVKLDLANSIDSDLEHYCRKKLEVVISNNIFSQLFYKCDPVGYEEMFENWVLDKLIEKGEIS